MSQSVTMFTTADCGPCRRLKHRLDEAGVEVHTIDVDVHQQHSEKIMAAAGGNRVVPTVEVGGLLLVNPSLDEVLAALAST